MVVNHTRRKVKKDFTVAGSSKTAFMLFCTVHITSPDAHLDFLYSSKCD